MAPADDGPATLREADLFPLAARGLLEAARDYVDLGFILRPRRRSRRLAAEVRGTEDVYACGAEVRRPEEGGPPSITPRCACPSRRPFCKHVLALLQLWVLRPEEFLALERVEERLRRLPSAELAALLCDVAEEGRDLTGALAAATAPSEWDQAPPGACLQEWERFREDSREAGRWPEAALLLGSRIAGPPGSPVPRPGAATAVGLRQLAWWLTLLCADLPEPAIRPWARHLEAQLEAAQLVGGTAAALPPELAPHLARLACALPAGLGGERRWLAAFAAAVPTLAGPFEAQAAALLWDEELAARLAVSPRLPEAAGARCREVLEVFQGAPA
jgi:hypothetical protein